MQKVTVEPLVEMSTSTIMLIGIAIVLIVITCSIWQPVVIIGSLILAYFTTLGMTEIISDYVKGQSLLSWNVPFFVLS